ALLTTHSSAHSSLRTYTVALLRLSRKYAGNYWPFIILVVILQLTSTIAALYLPSHNARIIDDGVAEGDTDFILSTGMTMLLVCLVQVITAISAMFFCARTRLCTG